MTGEPSFDDLKLRQAALDRLHKKREFLQHATAYVVVNLALNVVWLLTTPDRFYWPVLPLLGWGIGLVFHAIDAYAPGGPSEERIRREMNRLARR